MQWMHMLRWRCSAGSGQILLHLTCPPPVTHAPMCRDKNPLRSRCCCTPAGAARILLHLPRQACLLHLPRQAGLLHLPRQACLLRLPHAGVISP
jgi:hypothetical protein